MSKELNRIYKYVDGHKRVRKKSIWGKIIDTSEEKII